ncbi:sensor histidine kinase [Microbacterium sp. STN6]|uniref:sensor histidine kinase n=1 Tax=Microbacterium sp. STN6 TaxID=2995588 RepID=UPI002260ABAE|nr:sensor histidine kinase [Microbacterium sp. STN6]MCX7522339.1 sensor histidine kinase [Microbacterium sp. STN6]
MPMNPEPPWAGAGQPHGAEERQRRRRVQRWIPAVVAAVAQLPALVIAGARHAPLPVVLALVLAFAASFALLFVRRRPVTVLATIAVMILPAIALVGGPPAPALPLAIAIVIAVVHGLRLAVWVTIASLAVAEPLVVMAVSGARLSIVRVLAIVLVLSLLVGIGEAIRTRRERFREISRRIAVQRQSEAEAERVRIARELHDVLAHSLSQISVQAGVGLHLFDSQPERAKESLESIKTTSRQALDEVRGVLGFLREEGTSPTRTPGPGLASLPALVESFASTGLTVSVLNELGDDVPPAAQLVLYRIVQESLTNTARHAATGRAEVVLAAADGWYEATIIDHGGGPPTGGREGRGLLGMRERAELFGGTLEAGRGDNGGFRVHARIPSRPRTRDDGFGA